MEVPMIPILIIAMLLHAIWTGTCCWKAKKAYLAAEKLYKWVNSAHEPLICAVKKTECEEGSGGWPPEPVGRFPPAG